jgi:hypothetical protein
MRKVYICKKERLTDRFKVGNKYFIEEGKIVLASTITYYDVYEGDMFLIRMSYKEVDKYFYTIRECRKVKLEKINSL